MTGHHTKPCTVPRQSSASGMGRHRWSISGMCKWCGLWKRDVVVPNSVANQPQRRPRKDELI